MIFLFSITFLFDIKCYQVFSSRAIIQPDAIPNLNGPKVTGISYPIVTAGKVKLTDFQEETQR